MKKTMLTVLLSTALAASTMGAVAVTAFAEGESTGPRTETISFGDLQTKTVEANYGLAAGDVANYGVKTGKVNALKDFDTNTNGKLTSAAAPNVECQNWWWQATNADSVIVVFEFKVDAVVNIESSKDVGGWLDTTTSIIVSLKSGDTITELQKTFPTKTDKSLVAYSGTVKAGDTLYYEFNTTADKRNIQSLQNITAVLTEDKGVTEEKTAEQYKQDLETYVATLTQSDYAADQWTAIGNIVEGFIETAGDKTGILLKVEYEKQLNAIKAVPTIAQQLTAQIEAHKKAFNAKVDKLNADNFTEENYTNATALKAEFATAIAAAETIESANEIFKDYVGRLNAIESIKVSTSFLDLPDHTHEADFGLYKNMGIVEYGLKYGKVLTGMYEYDRYAADTSSIRLYTSEFGEKDVVARNWCWEAVKERSVIAEFKALKDMSLTIASTRITNGGAPGWTVNTNITVYIQRGEFRGENVKAIYSINTPSTDEQFGGTFYLKAGDILYYEFNTDHMNQTVNIQTPIETTMTADTTGFDQTKYEDQNNDLPQAVVDAVAAKLAELTTFVQGKTESSYSATNWAALQAIPEAFSAACETRLLRTSTVDDVNTIYDEFHTQAEGIETLTQAQDELVRYKDEKKQEVRAYADQMLKDNKYSKENKELIESYVTEANTAIDAANTKGAINTAVTTAKNRINNVEVSKGGCGGSIATGAMGIAVALAFGGVLLAKKSRKEN